MDSNVGHVNTGGNREDKLVIISRGGGVVLKQVRPQKCRHILAPLRYYKTTYRHEQSITSVVLEHLKDPKSTTLHSWYSIKTLCVLLIQRHCKR